MILKIWGWEFKTNLYLEKLKSYCDFTIYIIIILFMAGMLLLACRRGWGYFTISLETIDVENVGIDT